MKKIPYTKFGKTKLVPHITYTNNNEDKPPKDKWDREMWIERGEDWYGLMCDPHKTTLIIERHNFIDAEEVK